MFAGILIWLLAYIRTKYDQVWNPEIILHNNQGMLIYQKWSDSYSGKLLDRHQHVRALLKADKSNLESVIVEAGRAMRA